MNPSVKKPFDDWADSVNHNEELVLATLSPLFDHLLRSWHGRGRAHGNIRPEAIFVLEDNSIDLDSFSALSLQDADAQSPYASPDGEEDGQNGVSILGDIYSISAVCYRAVSGQTPLKASNRKRRPDEKIHFPQSVSGSLQDAIRIGLAIDPQNRPQSLLDLQDLLQKVRAAESSEAHTEQAPELKSSASEPVVPPPPPAPPKVPNPVKRLPTNLTAGQACRVPLANVIPDLGEWKFDLQESEALGAAYDGETDELVFNPTQAGEHVLTLELSHADDPDRPALPKPIAVTVNPDPDSLWQNKPSDPSVPYYKVDTDCKEVVTPVARILAASQRGRSHAHEGSCRDDDFLVRYDETTGWHLLAAADGAGSAKFSRQGSLIACTEAIAHMESWLGKETANLSSAVEQCLSSELDQKHLRNCAYAWLGGAAFEALKAIKAEAEKRDPPATVRDFHTTLLLAVAKVTPSGWLLVTFSVGDGGIAAVSADGQPVSLCTPDSGDFSGQTVFLTGPGVLRSGEDVANRIHIQLLPDFSALFLLTDGVTDPKFPTDASFVDKDTWSAFLHELAEKVNFGEAGDGAETRLLSWLSFRSPGNHDDRTIVALLDAPPPPPESAKESEEGSSTGFLSWFRGGRKKKQEASAT